MEEPTSESSRLYDCQKKVAEAQAMRGDMTNPEHVQYLIDCLEELKVALEESKKREDVKKDLIRLVADLKMLKEELKKLTR